MSSTPTVEGPATLTINEISEQIEAGIVRPGALIEGSLGDQEGGFFSVSWSEGTGRVPAHEVSGLKTGDSASFFVEDVAQGEVLLSFEKAQRLEIWNWLEEQRQSGTAVKATVISESRGALAVDVRGLKAILAHRDLEAGTSRDIGVLRGQEIEVQITQLREKKAQIIVSQRALTEGTLEERKAATMASLEEGQVLEGEVRRLANFGAFVDIGGIDGLLHVKDMKWKRVNHPGEVVQVGDFVTVKVLSFRMDSEKISLGMKQLMPDPWSDAEQRYRSGRKVSGDVVGLTDFGAFIMLEDGIEGLVHISEMSWTQKVKKPNDVLTPGDQVDAWVLRCDIERRRLGLTLKNPEDSPWVRIQERFPVGDAITTKVTNVVDFGLFVELADGLEGLVHISDFSWNPITESPQDLYQVGQSIDVMVLDIDAERGRANLGIKQLQEDEASTQILEYEVGQTLDAKVTGIQSYGVFAELSPGLEGMIHISELRDGTDDPSSLFSLDDVVSVEITAIDVDEKRISLRLSQASTVPSAVTEAQSDMDPNSLTDATPDAAETDIQNEDSSILADSDAGAEAMPDAAETDIQNEDSSILADSDAGAETTPESMASEDDETSAESDQGPEENASVIEADTREAREANSEDTDSAADASSESEAAPPEESAPPAEQGDGADIDADKPVPDND